MCHFQFRVVIYLFSASSKTSFLLDTALMANELVMKIFSVFLLIVFPNAAYNCCDNRLQCYANIAEVRQSGSLRLVEQPFKLNISDSNSSVLVSNRSIALPLELNIKEIEGISLGIGAMFR